MREARATPARGLIRTVAATLGAVALAAAGAGAVASSPAQAAAGEPGTYHDGVTKYSTVVNCASTNQRPAFTEPGAGTQVGVFMDPDEPPPVPSVGQRFTVRVVVHGLGSPCRAQRFLPALDLPAHVSFDRTQRIRCFRSGVQLDPGECPQWRRMQPAPFAPGASAYLSTDRQHDGTWSLPQARTWEFRFPVVASRQVDGSPLLGYVKVRDGDENPVLKPHVPLHVFGTASTPVVLHDWPSTVADPWLEPGAAPSAYGVVSTGLVVTHGAAGYLRLQRGTEPGVYTESAVFGPVGSSRAAWSLRYDWDMAGFDPVEPGTRYYWRIGFDPGDRGGDTVWGGGQSFRGLWSQTCGGKAVTVSTGLGQLGTPGTDVVLGTRRADRIVGGAGVDTVCAGGGADVVSGGGGPDVLLGARGGDRLSGGAGGDQLAGGAGRDRCDGGSGTDTATGCETRQRIP